jgi:hypothetical protein
VPTPEQVERVIDVPMRGVPHLPRSLV